MTRAQTATLLARSAQVLHDAGRWEGKTYAIDDVPEIADAPSGIAGEWPAAVAVRSDAVVISSNVVIEGELEARTVTVQPGGTLESDPHASTSLTVTGNVVVEGTLTMQPDGPSVDHVIRFVAIDETAFVGGGHSVVASDTGLWSTGHGQAIIDGSERLAWSRADASLGKGERTVRLEDDPTDWRVGDELAITPTSAPGTAGHRT